MLSIRVYRSKLSTALLYIVMISCKGLCSTWDDLLFLVSFRRFRSSSSGRLQVLYYSRVFSVGLKPTFLYIIIVALVASSFVSKLFKKGRVGSVGLFPTLI